MISYISGILAEIGDRDVVVETGGIGYGIYVPQTCAAGLIPGQQVRLYTHLHVTEDAMKLYGFPSAEDREMFRLLIGVSGVGPKVALNVMSSMDSDGLRLAILSDDEKKLAKTPGLGPKTAKKVILELKDKMKLTDVTAAAGTGRPEGSPEREEAVQALMALGYGASEALKAVGRITETEGLQAGAIVRLALRELAR